jgi:predicted metal-dependent hydrolase
MDLPYQLIRSRKRRRTISLNVRENGEIALYVPFSTSQREIERFLAERRPWISRKLAEKERRQKETARTFADGERFLFLGEWYPLVIEETDQEVPFRLHAGRFLLMRPYTENTRDLFIRWYQGEAKERIVERTLFYGRRHLLSPEGVRITSARHRWGSCSRKNRLCFSWRIIMAPLPVIDYVVIHELVHIREKNHSRRFWTHVESILPDYRKRRQWLNEHGHLLQI